jgi:predicted transposase YdaD
MFLQNRYTFFMSNSGLEEEDKMRYVTSIERLAMAEGRQEGRQEGIQQGIQQGKSWALRQVLALRFANADLTRYQTAIDQAAEDQLVNYIIKASTVATIDEVFLA